MSTVPNGKSMDLKSVLFGDVLPDLMEIAESSKLNSVIIFHQNPWAPLFVWYYFWIDCCVVNGILDVVPVSCLRVLYPMIIWDSVYYTHTLYVSYARRIVNKISTKHIYLIHDWIFFQSWLCVSTRLPPISFSTLVHFSEIFDLYISSWLILLILP